MITKQENFKDNSKLFMYFTGIDRIYLLTTNQLN